MIIFNHYYKKLLKRFKWHSIFVLNLKRTIIIVAIPLIVINVFVNVFYYKTVYLESRAAANQVFSAVSKVMESIYRETEDIYYILATKNGMDVLMSTDTVVGIDPGRHRSIMNLIELAKTYCALSSSIESIDIYSHSAKYVISTNVSGNIEKISDKPWVNISSEQMSFLSPRNNSFSICYNVTNGKEKVGLVIFNIRPTEIKNMIVEIVEKNYSIQLYDENKKPIFTLGTLFGSSPDFSASRGNEKLNLTNKYAEMTSQIDSAYFYIVMEHVQPIYTNFVLISLLLIVLIMILSLIIAFLLSYYSYQTIGDIIMNINDVGIGEHYEDSMNEIMYINNNIFSMKSKNRQLEQELIKSFATLKRLQTQVLQVQFTPHFLFNALNTLNLSLILKHGADNPESDSIVILSDLLRSSIDVNHYMVTVDNELQFCNKYVKIQSLISNKNFDVEWNIEENIRKYMTIKFILQPLIENAFKHGIKYLKNKSRGMLSISANKQGESLVFRVTNNGPLPDEQMLQKLNNMMMNNIGSDDNHVGLFNVNKRIKLVFGDDYGCKIFIQNGLAVAELIMPIITESDISEIR